MICGVIFDLDGVIADTERLHQKAWKIFSQRYKHDLLEEDIKKTFGRTNFEIFSDMFPEFSRKDYLELDEEKESIYRELAKKELNEILGATRLIKELHDRGIKLIIGSSGNPANIEFNLKKLGLYDYFLGYISSHDVKNGKPDPEVFLKSASSIGLTPDRCVVIEDSYHGIKAAKRAGMKVIALTTTHKKKALDEADLIVKNLKDLNADKILGLDD